MDSPRSEATRRVGWSVTDLTKVPIELVAIQVALSLRHDQAGKTIVNPRNAGDVSEKKLRKSGIQHFMVLDSLQMERLITGDHVMVPFIIWTR
jgi:hypothetical protein